MIYLPYILALLALLLLSWVGSGASVYWALLLFFTHKQSAALGWMVILCCLGDLLFFLPVGTHVLLMGICLLFLSYLPTSLWLRRISVVSLTLVLLVAQTFLLGSSIQWSMLGSGIVTCVILLALSVETRLETIG